MKKKFSFGPLFGENVSKNKGKSSLSSKETLEGAGKWTEKGLFDFALSTQPLKPPRWRAVVIFIIFVVVFVVLVARSFELQVIEGDSFLGKAQSNRYKVQTSYAPRGVIYDRNGKILARNVPAFKVDVDPLSISSNGKAQIIADLGKILGISTKKISVEIISGSPETVTITNNATHEQILKLETQELPGVEIQVIPKREYPFPEVGSHILGYTSEVSKEELENPQATPHQLGDRVGRSGVEDSFENTLRGANGYNLVKVDSTGKKQGSLIKTQPIAGSDLTLSIDIDLQKKLFQTLKKWTKNAGAKAGSAVVMDPNTGEILALASYPSFDNNIFENGLSQDKYNNLVNNTNKPLLNRAVGSSYPPGSTFKLVTAAAGLESGNISASTRIVDTGFIKLGDQVFNNWLWLDKKKTDGSINIIRAIARSNDTFFYKLGMRIGENAIQDMAKNFSLGSLTGINLPSETAGLVPTEQWKIDTKGEIWFPGETLNLAIGQGDLLVSPLQLSLVTAAFANGGKIVKPTILKDSEPEFLREGFLSDSTVKTVREGMYQNTIGDGNVSYLFSSFKPKTAGKTGTAESGNKRPHAWYTGFAPLDNPEIVVTIMVEHAGHGSEVSAPATKEIFDWYFKNK